mmetsp:Transcript_27378/g.68327  ORF Transcript_27378/g.68327 Transcript_27378/m.68327 type:complete len:128 (+) Transcript_27378:1351-1734(+)
MRVLLTPTARSLSALTNHTHAHTRVLGDTANIKTGKTVPCAFSLMVHLLARVSRIATPQTRTKPMDGWMKNKPARYTNKHKSEQTNIHTPPPQTHTKPSLKDELNKPPVCLLSGGVDGQVSVEKKGV